MNLMEAMQDLATGFFSNLTGCHHKLEEYLDACIKVAGALPI